MSDPTPDPRLAPREAAADRGRDTLGASPAITFTTEELAVLAQLDDHVLPMVGARPLPGLTAAARDAVLDVAARSLLARGVLVRDGEVVGVARAAAGLIGIVGASSLRVQVLRGVVASPTVAGPRGRTIYAIPYAAVDTSVDLDGNHRFVPFATVDVLLHVGHLTGLLPPDDHEEDLADGADQPVGLPYGAWRAAREAVALGEDVPAASALVDGGLAGATAEVLLEVLRASLSPPGVQAVQIVHHPSATTTAGGEVAWVDAGTAGIWTVPTIDQPFARIDRPGLDEDEVAELDRTLSDVEVHVARTTRATLLRDLHSVLPTAG